MISKTTEEIAELVADRMNGEYRVEISKTIGLGDSGLPFHLIVDVDYRIPNSKKIVITSFQERECPYDNPSDKWHYQVADVVSEYFHEKDPELGVYFLDFSSSP